MSSPHPHTRTQRIPAPPFLPFPIFPSPILVSPPTPPSEPRGPAPTPRAPSTPLLHSSSRSSSPNNSAPSGTLFLALLNKRISSPLYTSAASPATSSSPVPLPVAIPIDRFGKQPLPPLPPAAVRAVLDSLEQLDEEVRVDVARVKEAISEVRKCVRRVAKAGGV